MIKTIQRWSHSFQKNSQSYFTINSLNSNNFSLCQPKNLTNQQQLVWIYHLNNPFTIPLELRWQAVSSSSKIIPLPPQRQCLVNLIYLKIINSSSTPLSTITYHSHHSPAKNSIISKLKLVHLRTKQQLQLHLQVFPIKKRTLSTQLEFVLWSYFKKDRQKRSSQLPH